MNTIKIPLRKIILETIQSNNINYSQFEITEGYLGDTFKKYKRPLIAGALAGFLGATGTNIYQGSYSPTAKTNAINVENSMKKSPLLKEYSNLTDEQRGKALDEKFKEDKIGAINLVGNLVSEPEVKKALQTKNEHIENLNNNYLKRDLPLGMLSGSLLLGGLAARRRNKAFK